MANILYMAESRDGFIAGVNDETPWSDEEWQSFQSFCKSCDMVLLGKRTYELMRAGDEFLDGVRYVVVTHDKSADTGNFENERLTQKRTCPRPKESASLAAAN